MKKLIVCSMVILLCSCKNKKIQQDSLTPISSYFPKEKAKVLVVGTFHLDYPNLDAHKTSDENKIDVLKEPKKSEITELVNYIKKFKPTKIAIEAFPNFNATEKLKEYKLGKHRNERDERFQLGMRVATELNLDTIYSIDADNVANDLVKIDSSYVTALFKDYDFSNDDPYEGYYKKWLESEDKLPRKIKIIDYLKHINSRESHEYGYGLYLVGDFKLDNNRGADILAIWWYNRNLRIFRNIQLIDQTKNDRILVLIGNGHAAILRQLLEATPEYDFIEFDSL
ncbi:conserved hypothetical protein [Flavobacterium sp. 9AF]|uniref:DUF5694 domain-containing protein n=1 Tax=Flavobacterium sp. 9AF TaxID=2653142 RepID=UPI0012F191A6|nr:DUF5694 domain-containing protein [Flavobacterium sp. 9AF]VXC34322.1 conserved hypothetical protein [Flavobacterium sp. 9AF]